MGAITILIFYTIQVPMFSAVPPDIKHEIFQLSIVLSVTDRVNVSVSWHLRMPFASVMVSLEFHVDVAF